MSNKLAVIKQELYSDKIANRFQEVNKSGLDFQREAGFMMQHLNNNSYLAGADKMSIMQSVINCSLTGLSLNPMLNQAYPVPRKVKGVILCVIDPGYQGLISVMINSGNAKDVYAHVVFEGDEFEYNMAENRVVKHTPYWLAGNEKGKEIAAYAAAVLPDGTKKFEVKPYSYILEVEKTSEAAKKGGGPWKGAFREEMVKKTMVKVLWKYMNKNKKAEEVAKIIDHDNEVAEYNLDNKKVASDKSSKVVEEAEKAMSGKPSSDNVDAEETGFEEVEEEMNSGLPPTAKKEEPVEEKPKAKKSSGSKTKSKPKKEETSHEDVIAQIENIGDFGGTTRPFPEMKTVKAIFDKQGWTKEDFDKAIKKSKLDYADKDDVCRRGSVDDIKVIIEKM